MLVDSRGIAEDHRRCDTLFAAAREAAGEGRAERLGELAGALREALLAHFRYEEQHLFPLYEQSNGAASATEWLRAQHDDMRGTLWLLATVSPQAEPQRYRAELAALQEAFDAHAAEEEARMYPVLEGLLGRR